MFGTLIELQETRCPGFPYGEINTFNARGSDFDAIILNNCLLKF